MREKRADLHIHTTCSDGSFTSRQVIEHAKKIELSCLAISDHDSIDGVQEAIDQASSCGIEVIPAVEMSAEENGKELHILGYLIDHRHQVLTSTLKQIREDRKQRLRMMTDALSKEGIDIDADELMKFAGDVSISRLHIAQYMQHKGIVSSWKEAFVRYIGDDKPCYIASFRLSARQVVDIIKCAQGIPVIAHPGLNNVEQLLPKLVEQGIAGIEVFHSEHSRAVTKRLERYARKNGLYVTGGSDCHGRSKGRVLMGNTTVAYSCVEEMKSRSTSRQK